MVATNKRVLVVDDEEIVRRSYQRALTDAGYSVRAVGSGREALQACRNEPFDLMLADLKMPEMDGIEVTRAVRREFPDVRVVIITGYPSRASWEQTTKLGIFDYLEKPLSPERLSAATAAALASPPMPMAVPDVHTPMQDSEAAVPELTLALRIEDPVVPRAVPAPQREDVAIAETAEPDISTWKGLVLLALSPFIGLAYVVFLPLIGFGMLFAIIGISLAEKLGWTHK